MHIKIGSAAFERCLVVAAGTGEAIPDVVEADDSAGWYRVLKRNAAGDLVTAAGEPVRTRLYGAIAIIDRPAEPRHHRRRPPDDL